MATSAIKKRSKRKFSECAVHIQATFNNTVVSGTTVSGDVLCQSSAGHCGFKGSRKGTPYAGQLAAENVAKMLIENYDARRVSIYVSGAGGSREAAIRAIQNYKTPQSFSLEVTRLVDTTKLPHNGCRPKKKRRV